MPTREAFAPSPVSYVSVLDEHGTLDEELDPKAPIKRVAGFDVPVPLPAREQAYLPSVEGILGAAREVLAY